MINCINNSLASVYKIRRKNVILKSLPHKQEKRKNISLNNALLIRQVAPLILSKVSVTVQSLGKPFYRFDGSQTVRICYSSAESINVVQILETRTAIIAIASLLLLQ